MDISEKVAYIKGLAEGMKLDDSTDTGKIIHAIVDVLDDMALAIEDIENTQDELSELVDILDEDLGEIESDFYEAEDDDEDEEDIDLDDMYEVTCPYCGEVTYINEDMANEGGMECPGCGEKLEFDLSCDCGCEGDSCSGDCSCGHDHE